jgi:hypothetical protein
MAKRRFSCLCLFLFSWGIIGCSVTLHDGRTYDYPADIIAAVSARADGAPKRSLVNLSADEFKNIRLNDPKSVSEPSLPNPRGTVRREMVGRAPTPAPPPGYPGQFTCQPGDAEEAKRISIAALDQFMKTCNQAYGGSVLVLGCLAQLHQECQKVLTCGGLSSTAAACRQVDPLSRTAP